MSRRGRGFVRESLGIALLYILAAPIYLVRAAFRFVRALVAFRIARADAIDCPHCGAVNPLDILATCRRCRATEFGSRLHCSNCHDVIPGFSCDSCGALIRVL